MKKIIMSILAILVITASAQVTWTTPKLIGTYTNWNYWWLNVRIGIDQYDTVYCAVARYNYSQQDYDHDLYVLNADGDTINVIRPWSGFDYQPIVQDAQSNNIYLGQPVIGQGDLSSPHMDAGVTDDSNCVNTTHGTTGDIVYFTRLGPNGEHIIWLDTIYAGNPWPGRTNLTCDARGVLHCAFADDMQHLAHGISTDRGESWTWDTLESVSVMSHVRIVPTPDTCVHIVYRTWTSGVQLYYMKLRPDGSVAVAPSLFAEGSERWCPNVAVDQSGNLRVVYVDHATESQNLWYTVLRSDLDTGGQPAPDSLLTTIPDTIILTDPVRIAGPKICVDSENRAHVLFEQGVYGTMETKYVYHIREEGDPGIVEFSSKPVKPSLFVLPNPVITTAKIQFNLVTPGNVQLVLYDALGRQVKEILNRTLNEGCHTVQFDRTGLSAGTYFCLFRSTKENKVAKFIVTD